MTVAPRQSDTPKVGHYLLKLIKGGPWVAAEITHDDEGWKCMIDGEWQGPSRDPWLLSNMERIHWGGRETTPSEAAYRVAVSRYAKIYDPSSPIANPHKAINLDTHIPYKRKRT